MGRDEVQRHAGRLAVGDHLGDPGVACRGRASHAALGACLLHRAGRPVVEREVVLLLAREEAVEVGLVPDLEVPAGHFFSAIAFDAVGDEGLDEPRPFLMGFRRE